MRGTIKIEGFSELERLLKQLPRTVARKLARQALRVGAKIVQREAKQRAPKNTGTLAAGIKVRAAKAKKKDRTAVMVRVGDGHFKGETFYSGFIEFGYEKVPTIPLPGGKFKSAKRGSEPTTTIPPRPFMRPAFDAKKEEAARAIGKALGELIEESAQNKGR